MECLPLNSAFILLLRQKASQICSEWHVRVLNPFHVGSLHMADCFNQFRKKEM